MARNLVGFVTGGASGLGKATAERFVKDGGKVVIFDLPSSNGAEVASSLGENAKFSPGDVSDENDVSKAIELTQKSFGKLDVAVNCAATSVGFKTYNFIKDRPHLLHDFVRVLTVNTVGTFNVTRLAAGLIGRNKPDEDGLRGLIIFTSAYAATNGSSGQVAYAASTAAINGMTIPISRDLGIHGIRCCTIAPGLFDTPLISPLPEKVRTYLTKCTLAQRFGRPEDYAQLVMSIIDTPYLNGEVIKLDGGLHLL